PDPPHCPNTSGWPRGTSGWPRGTSGWPRGTSGWLRAVLSPLGAARSLSLSSQGATELFSLAVPVFLGLPKPGSSPNSLLLPPSIPTSRNPQPGAGGGGEQRPKPRRRCWSGGSRSSGARGCLQSFLQGWEPSLPPGHLLQPRLPLAGAPVGALELIHILIPDPARPEGPQPIPGADPAHPEGPQPIPGADPAHPERSATPTPFSLSSSGRFLPEEQPQGWLCLRKLLFFNLSVLEEGERLTMAQLELRFQHNSYHSPRPGQVLELRLYPANPRGQPRPGRGPLLERSFVQLHKSLLFKLSAALEDGKMPGRNLTLVLEISASSGASGSPRSLCAGSDAL
ncbi:LOW QUALITY PROTEIN: uncharacterized protein LOC111940455, partial [Cyanistes caeruleus]|uniref:LOW QUALITY PROTEIN: uncharacterized protein LOC111940455 n=1 Tax=Cyanistes caeruleus TaxID=156563 RepID=UPI000CDA743F